MPEPMSDEEYAEAQTLMITLGNLAERLEVDRMLKSIGRAHALTPIIDPTLYRRGAARLQKIAALARAFAGVQRAHAELRELVVEEEGRR